MLGRWADRSKIEKADGMGHLIDYLVAVDGTAARAALKALSGFWGDPYDDGAPTTWEGRTPSGQEFWANPGGHACLFTLSRKYSLFIAGDPSALESVRSFEEWLLSALPEGDAVRLDEFVRIQWEREVRAEWWKFVRPTEQILSWIERQLIDTRLHYVVLRSEALRSGTP